MPDGMDVGVCDDQHTQPCAQCAKPFEKGEDVIHCFGKCRLSIHKACLPGATAEEVSLLCKLNNAVFACDACIALNDYDDMHWKKSLDDIHVKLNSLACVVDFINGFQDKVRQIVRSELVNSERAVSVPEQKEVSNSEPRRVLRSTTLKRKIDADVQNGTNGGETPKANPTFAEVMKIKRAKKAEGIQEKTNTELNPKPDPIIIVKPKEGVETANTKKELRKKVNPKDINVKRVIEGKDGAVFVVLNDEASSKTLKESVEKVMGSQFEVKLKESMKPAVKIVGITEEMDENELKLAVTEQNECFDGLKHFKLRKFYRKQNLKYAEFTAVVELDAPTFFKVMEKQKINVGWDRCRVFDGLDVLRCFKCCGYNHKIADCKAEVDTCLKCAGNHRAKDCVSTEEKCVNCEKYRVARKLDIETDHAAWNVECPVYQRFLKLRDKQVDYSD